MNVLVTGASGFSGASVCRTLAEDGHAVTALHRSTTRFLAGLEGVPNIALAQGDLAAGSRLRGPFDVIVHAAATSPGDGIDAARIAHDNVSGTAAILGAARRWGVRSFVLYSSLSMYGHITTDVVSEDTPIVNPDAYGASKHLCELMVKDCAGSLAGIALRLPGVIGPGAHRNWLSSVADRLIAREVVRVYHPDRPFNNAAHVSEVSSLVSRLVSNPWNGFDAVVLGARGEMRIRDVVHQLAAGLGVATQIEEVSSTHTSFTLSSERAIRQWGYEPSAIGEMIDRYASDVVTFRRTM